MAQDTNLDTVATDNFRQSFKDGILHDASPLFGFSKATPQVGTQADRNMAAIGFPVMEIVEALDRVAAAVDRLTEAMAK